MKTVTRICDRCGGVLVDQGSIVEVKAGDLVHQIAEPLDLCSDCGPLFLDWLRSGKPHQSTPTTPPVEVKPRRLVTK